MFPKYDCKCVFHSQCAEMVPLIHQPVLRTKYAECNLLFQLIKVINSLKNDPCDTILKKVHLRTHTNKGFASNVTHVLLNAYDPICRLRVCYVFN